MLLLLSPMSLPPLLAAVSLCVDIMETEGDNSGVEQRSSSISFIPDERACPPPFTSSVDAFLPKASLADASLADADPFRSAWMEEAAKLPSTLPAPDLTLPLPPPPQEERALIVSTLRAQTPRINAAFTCQQ